MKLSDYFIRKQEPVTLSNDFKSVLRHFVYYYTNNTLQFVVGDKTILADINYTELLKDEPSLVETAFAIFTNNIKMDHKGKVHNAPYAMKRAAQWIRFVCPKDGETYTVTPPFEDWETYLY